MEKKEVLIYNSTLERGGTETYICNLIESLDKEKFNITVLIKNGENIDDVNFSRLKDAGAKIFFVNGNLFSKLQKIKSFFVKNKNKYDIVHINATSQGVGIIAYFAKKYGKAKKVIFHSHMGGNDNKKSLVDKIGQKMIFKYSDKLVACSKVAGEFMFGKNILEMSKFGILRNSINTKKFYFDRDIRKSYRKNLKINEDSLVLLHVGRFAIQKNHKFLINVFNEVQKKNNNSILVLVGDGELLEQTKDQVKKLSLEDKVKFLGIRSDIAELMMMADVFIMPSIHEGLGIVLIESQASNLPVVASDMVPSEAKINDNFSFLSLNSSFYEWSDEILRLKDSERKSKKSSLIKCGYDNDEALRIVEELYLN